MRCNILRLTALSFATMAMAVVFGQSPEAVKSVSDLVSLRDSRFVAIENRPIEIYDVATPRTEIAKQLFHIREHVAFDSLFTSEFERGILEKINERCDRLGKDTLLTSDLLWVYRPYLDWLFNEDPHYRIEGVAPVNNIRDAQKIKVPAFDILCINDTVIIARSLDANFRKGDRIISINGVPMAEYLNYTYPNRYDTPANIMRHYHFGNVADVFDIRLERGGQRLDIKTSGKSQNSMSVKLTQMSELTAKIFPEAKSGFISIPKFYPDNSRLIKILHKKIKEFRVAGLTNVILDLRMNPGGNGDRFDELLSIFIDKPVVKYLRGAKVKGSARAMELYDFLTEDMNGKIVDMPDTELVKEFPTVPGMYIDGMNYYVLMSRNTGSIAASFCNALQYNGVAKLVGEPLLKNAIKYGETIPGRVLLPTLLRETAISIVEFDEYTNAVDGVIMPDIEIPYRAADYLGGDDAMVDKLLETI